MTTYRGHYLPVAARRRVLSIYRDRRSTSTWSPWATGPLPPMAAMHETRKFFEGWLAHAVAFGPVGRHSVQDLTDQYRAACFYLNRMYDKPEAFKNCGRVRRSSDRVIVRRGDVLTALELTDMAAATR